MTYQNSKVVREGNTLRVIRETRVDMDSELQNANRLRLVSRPVEAVNRRTGKRTRHGLIEFERQLPIVIEGREYTRSGIARASGVDITFISKVFRGERTPSLYRARLISAAIGVDLQTFYDILTKIDVGQHIEAEDRLTSTIQPLTPNP